MEVERLASHEHISQRCCEQIAKVSAPLSDRNFEQVVEVSVSQVAQRFFATFVDVSLPQHLKRSIEVFGLVLCVHFFWMVF